MYQITGTVNAAATTAPGCAWTTLTGTVTSLEGLSNLMRVAECSYSSTPPTLPDCIASTAGACPDGSGASIAFGKVSETQSLGYFSLTRTDGLMCAYDLTADWLSP